MKQNNDFIALERLNLAIKAETVKALLSLGYGHFGGSLSISETLACLYGKYLKHDPANPKMADRDYLVLSKGHAGPALYATLALRGFFSTKELTSINANGTNLPSHADMNKTPGVDMTTGSLGQGISCAAGIAMGTRSNVFAIVGDGELQEGQCWEAFQFAAHHRLSNMIVFVDHNKRQLDGDLEDIQCAFDLPGKFRAFGFHAMKVDGQDIHAISKAIEQGIASSDKPTAIILDTQKGQGVPSIVAIKANHHLRIDDSNREAIRQDLRVIEQKLEKLR